MNALTNLRWSFIAYLIVGEQALTQFILVVLIINLN